MKNTMLNTDLKTLLKDKANLSVTKGDVSGVSIDIVNTRTMEDMGSYPYYKNEANRDADFDKLQALLN